MRIDGSVEVPDSIVKSPTRGIDERHFRDVLGQLPTGVAIIASRGSDDVMLGMAVGSLASVSLNPPLVSFMAARTSTTFPRILETGRFVASVLSANQDHICRRFAIPGGDKFEGLAWDSAPSGLPLIQGALAWIDCGIEAVLEAGDHLIAVGSVTCLDSSRSGSPLVFFRGGYGGFATKSLMAAPQDALTKHLRLAGRARSTLETLAKALDLEAHASVAVQGHYVVAALSDAPSRSYSHSRLGYRAPLAFPVGAGLVAWEAEDDPDLTGWMPADEARSSSAVQQLARVRRRRWSVSLGHSAYDQLERVLGEVARGGGTDEEARELELIAALPSELFDPELEVDGIYNVRLLSSPVFGAEGEVVLALGLRGFDDDLSGREIEAIARQLVIAADRLTEKLGGRVPAIEEQQSL